MEGHPIPIQWLQNKKDGLERKFKTSPILLLGKRHEAYVEYNTELEKWEWRIIKRVSNWYTQQERSIVLLSGFAASAEEARRKAEQNLQRLMQYCK